MVIRSRRLCLRELFQVERRKGEEIRAAAVVANSGNSNTSGKQRQRH